MRKSEVNSQQSVVNGVCWPGWISGVDLSFGRQDMRLITAIARPVVGTDTIGDGGLFGLDSSSLPSQGQAPLE